MLSVRHPQEDQQSAERERERGRPKLRPCSPHSHDGCRRPGPGSPLIAVAWPSESLRRNLTSSIKQRDRALETLARFLFCRWRTGDGRGDDTARTVSTTHRPARGSGDALLLREPHRMTRRWPRQEERERELVGWARRAMDARGQKTSFGGFFPPQISNRDESVGRLDTADAAAGPLVWSRGLPTLQIP